MNTRNGGISRVYRGKCPGKDSRIVGEIVDIGCEFTTAEDSDPIGTKSVDNADEDVRLHR
jgi:hypothetical protein